MKLLIMIVSNLNYAVMVDQMDTPLYNPDMEIFIDGSFFVHMGSIKQVTPWQHLNRL